MSTTVNPDDTTKVFCSPYNTYRAGDGSVFTNNPGWYMKFNWTGTSLTLNIDTSIYGGNNNVASIGYIIDGGAESRRDLQASDTTYTVATGLSDTTHSAVINYKATNIGSNRWNSTPNAAFHCTGLVLDTGKTCSLPTLLPGYAMFICDSIGEGVEALGVGSTYDHQDATNAWTRIAASLLLCEVGVIAYASQGLVLTGLGNVPNANNAWGLYYASTSRLSGGLLSPAPTVVVTGHGANGDSGDQTAMGTLLTSIRAAAPAAKIVIAINWKADEVTPLTNAKNTFNDPKCYLLNTGTTSYSANSPHLTNAGALAYGTDIAAIFPDLGLSVGPGSVAYGLTKWAVGGSFNRLG